MNTSKKDSQASQDNSTRGQRKTFVTELVIEQQHLDAVVWCLDDTSR